jgi:hypothetical protein
MKKQLLLFVLMLLPMVASAEEVEINGLWYNLVSKAKVAEVIQNKNNQYYSGNIVIPDVVINEGVEYNVTTIGESAFSYCSKLYSISIPNSINNIGNNAFSGCNNLNAVYISDLEAWCMISFDGQIANPLNFAHHLYLNGVEIIDLEIPNGVTDIDGAFCGCSSFRSVTIPNSVTSMDGAFIGCTNLTSVSIPNSVTSIADAFCYCFGLTSVTLSNNITSIDNTFNGCSSLTAITIPNSVTSIETCAFSDCI